MSFQFSQYDPDDYSVIFNFIPIEGFAEDDFISIEMDSEGYSDEVGCDGHVVRMKNADERATVTFTIKASSTTNKVLSALYQFDRKAPGSAGVGPLLIRDTQGVTVFAGTNAWIAGWPKTTIGKRAGDREWKIRVAKLESFLG